MNKKVSSSFSTRVLGEVVTFVALATALSFVKIYTFPQGGSVTAGSMVPILWLALRRGPRIGLFTAIVYGLVQLAVEPYFYNPAQVLLDYPLAFGALGLAGFFQKRPLAGVILGVVGRFVMHFLSGILFFASFAPEGMNPLLYSALYNGSYLIPELAISCFIVYLLEKSNVLRMQL
jgi:thiamine transporter